MLEELREIRKLLTPPPKPDPPKGFVNEFRTFLSQYKVLGLAVAFILGIYLGALIKSLVDNLMMPLVSLIPGMEGIAWEEFVFGEFRVGLFVGDIITFVIIAFAVFAIVKIAARLGIE
ncbi:MAG: MscL family protein [Candidatus Thorarchaeota archaeon]|nr:MAG: MscL family protein [Candidatus Thorarchaeota archaeon]